jgi:hypothetical protein
VALVFHACCGMCSPTCTVGTGRWTMASWRLDWHSMMIFLMTRLAHWHQPHMLLVWATVFTLLHCTRINCHAGDQSRHAGAGGSGSCPTYKMPWSHSLKACTTTVESWTWSFQFLHVAITQWVLWRSGLAWRTAFVIGCGMLVSVIH